MTAKPSSFEHLRHTSLARKHKCNHLGCLFSPAELAIRYVPTLGVEQASGCRGSTINTSYAVLYNHGAFEECCTEEMNNELGFLKRYGNLAVYTLLRRMLAQSAIRFSASCSADLAAASGRRGRELSITDPSSGLCDYISRTLIYLAIYLRWLKHACR